MFDFHLFKGLYLVESFCFGTMMNIVGPEFDWKVSAVVYEQRSSGQYPLRSC